MLTDENLVIERPHSGGAWFGGVQRVYKFASGHGLSLVNSPRLHSYPFAWEAAVILDVTDDGDFLGLSYDTPLTDDVEVFFNDNDANAFIELAKEVLGTRKEESNDLPKESEEKSTNT